MFVAHIVRSNGAVCVLWNFLLPLLREEMGQTTKKYVKQLAILQ